MHFKLPKIYPITDTSLSGLSHAEQVRRLIAGGAALIQLRDKTASPRDFYAAAVEAIEAAREYGVKIIINDRVDIALAAGADGVHLGQVDMPPAAARAVLGEKSIIGLSTHSLEQAASAAGTAADYIAIGPVFPTQTKIDPDKVVGIEGVKAVRAVIGDSPLVAIGGITDDNLPAVLGGGADSAAIISGIFDPSEGIDARFRRLAAIADNC